MTRLSLLLSCATVLVACGETNNFFYEDAAGGGGAGTTGATIPASSSSDGTGAETGSGGDGGSGGAGGSGGSTVSAGGSGGTGGAGGDEPFLEGAPTPTTTVEDFEIDAFGVDGNRYWFSVDPREVERMNRRDESGDIYAPGGGTGATFANHFFATTAGDEPQTADFGKVETRIIGESTFREWTAQSIPNLRVDTEEFQEDLELDGYKDFRFNNGQVGTIFREELALEVYDRLGYPAPRATYAWVGSNVWGPDVQVPYTLVEVYKKGFCSKREEQFPDGCENMWEFVGDFGWTDFSDPDNCQFSECDSSRIDELDALIAATPPGPGFADALADYVDWDSMHRAQCLSWILWTGDDTFHNNNNNVIVERGDGKFQYLPYSIDISGGQEWYQYTPLYGNNAISRGCQADAECWADTIAVCEDLIEDFAAIDPAGLVDEVYGRLEGNGMLRDGDEARYEQIRAWYEQRVIDLEPELDLYREPQCAFPEVKCNGVCTPADACIQECDGGLVVCGASCVFPGECWECNFPFVYCDDGSCTIEEACPGNGGAGGGG